MKIKFGKTKTGRTIFVDGQPRGSVNRVLAKGDYVNHWKGEVTNFSGEIWRVSELTLKLVEDRVNEAFAEPKRIVL